MWSSMVWHVVERCLSEFVVRSNVVYFAAEQECLQLRLVAPKPLEGLGAAFVDSRPGTLHGWTLVLAPYACCGCCLRLGQTPLVPEFCCAALLLCVFLLWAGLCLFCRS